MATYGLVFNFIGALLLAIGSSIQTEVLTKIIDAVADNFGTWNMGKIPDELIKKFRNQKNISSWLNTLGYLLFIGGFGLQIIGMIKADS